MNRQRTTHAILAIIAFLLAAHLAMRLSGNEAHAQPPFNSAEPTVVGTSAEQIWRRTFQSSEPMSSWRIVRAWSDGQVDIARVTFTFIGSSDVDSITPPVVVIDPGP